MHPLRIFWYYLWIAPHAFQCVILFLMIRRRFYRQFPMFFLYGVSEIFQFVVLFSFSRSHLLFDHKYFGLYSASLALSAAIRFAVIQELFGHFFQRYPLLTRPGKLFLRAAILVLLLVSIGLAVLAPGTNADFLLHATYVFDRTASILQAGLLVCLFLFSRYFVLSWRSQAFGIALGFGIFASVDLASSAFRVYGVISQMVYDFINMGTYHCCVLIWIYYLVGTDSDHTHDGGGDDHHAVLSEVPGQELDVWNRELERLIKQ
jgi:hypothetical protein